MPKSKLKKKSKNWSADLFSRPYLPAVDNWLFINNSGEDYSILAEGTKEDEIVHNQNMWEQIKNRYEQKR